MDEIKWGFIGCGDVTEKKSGPAFQKTPHSSIAAVMRRDNSKARDYALRHNIPKWYDNADQLISDPDVNAIYVATPPDSHAEYAIKAMKAGKPVYVEKPMAANYSDCIRMNQVSAETQIPLFVAYYRRSLPYFKTVKELIDNEKIGLPLLINVKLFCPARSEDFNSENLPWRVKPEISGGGYFYDMACHTLDMLDFLFGPISEVLGIFANRVGLYNAEDVVTASFRFQNGLVGCGAWCFVSQLDSSADVVEIIGTKGKISFSTFEFSPIIAEFDNLHHQSSTAKPAHIQKFMIEAIVQELRGGNKSPSDGISAARTNAVMDTILQKINHS
jgi:1,5-anhydro-D-fructose reductase (1,5-anhydro-D-mannitol-forming)